MKVSFIVEGGSGPGNRRSGSLPSLALGPWETVTFESCGGAKRRAPPHDSNVTVSQGSRASLGGPERWPGPLCVYCKIVGGEQVKAYGKKQRQQRKSMKINNNMAKFCESNSEIDENQQQYG